MKYSPNLAKIDGVESLFRTKMQGIMLNLHLRVLLKGLDKRAKTRQKACGSGSGLFESPGSGALDHKQTHVHFILAIYYCLNYSHGKVIFLSFFSVTICLNQIRKCQCCGSGKNGTRSATLAKTLKHICLKVKLVEKCT